MGHEYTHSYRSLIHLAESLAGAGFPTLRFDYRGTGSSPGDALESCLLRSWIDDVEAASQLLWEVTGTAPSLVGLRIGATMAALAAARFAVEHLVAWAPVISGRRYVREREAIAKIAGIDRQEGARYLEAGGFILSNETVEELKAVDLRNLEYQVRGEVLFLERDDLDGRFDFGAMLAERGLQVDVREVSGYLEMMDEPHFSTVPHVAIAMISDWLAERVPLRAVSGKVRSLEYPPVRRDACGSEELLQFGTATTIFGIHTSPTGVDRARTPLLLLVNAGSVHLVGPNRVYVDLARGLAERGLPTLRIDLRNLGDSIRLGAPEENHPYPETLLDDVAEAVAWAKDSGYERIVVGGICSGAYAAFQSGFQLTERHLVGALVVNPLTFYWHEGLSLRVPPAFQTIKDSMYYDGAIRDARKWLRLLRGESDIRYILRFLGRRALETGRHTLRETMERLGLRAPEQLATDLLRFRTLGRRADFVFSRSDPGFGILMDGARRTVRRLKRADTISVSFVDDADHTFSRKEWREELARLVAERLDVYRESPPPDATKPGEPDRMSVHSK